MIMEDSDDSDDESDHEGEYQRHGGRGSGGAAAAGRLRMRDGDGDLLDDESGLGALRMDDSDDDVDSDLDDVNIETGEGGKFIIPDVSSSSEGEEDEGGADDNGDGFDDDGNKVKKVKKAAPVVNLSRKEQQRLEGTRSIAGRKRKLAPSSSAPGAEYRSKKAGGDVLRKGQKHEPYAYVPLDARALAGKGAGKKGGGKGSKQDEKFGAVAGLRQVVKRQRKGYQPRRGAPS